MFVERNGHISFGDSIVGPEAAFVDRPTCLVLHVSLVNAQFLQERVSVEVVVVLRVK